MFRVTFQDDLVRMIEKRGSPLGHPFHSAFVTDYWAAGRLQSVWLQGNTRKSSPIPPRWLLGTAPKRLCSIGASGWSVPAAAASRPIWWRE